MSGVVVARVAYEMQSEVGNRVACIYANLLKKIVERAVESGEQQNATFPESLRILGKIRSVKWAKCNDSGRRFWCFELKIGGRRSRRKTKQSGLLDVVVRLYDARYDEGL